jgi:NodT family efflux transporter outer membrane factor (OMF) lipoprotein
MIIGRSAAVSLILCATFLVACTLKPPPETADVVQDALPPTTQVPAGWTGPAEDSGYVDDGWLASFENPELEALVAEAIGEHNPNMRLLAAQVDRAAAASRLAGAALKPVVGLGADLSGTGGGGADSSTAGDVGVGVSWEVDVWGKLRAGREAADINLQATVLDFEFARMSLAANVAKSWFTATEARALVKLAEETLVILDELVRLTEKQQEVGQVSMQDVYLIHAQRDQAENALRQAIGGQKQMQRALEILVGRYPSAEIEGSDELSALPAPIPVGVPSDIIQRRPDLVAAERRVAAAFYLTEQANLARLPSFTLSAGVGGSAGLDNAIGQLGAGLFAPIFAGGALAAQVDQANADQEAAMAAYGQNLLKAFEEVETSLTNENLFKERERFLISAKDNNRMAYQLAQAQYNVGQTDLLSVLIIQAQWVGSQVGVVNIRSDRLTQRVDLHLALGGSFESKPESDAGGQGD